MKNFFIAGIFFLLITMITFSNAVYSENVKINKIENSDLSSISYTKSEFGPKIESKIFDELKEKQEVRVVIMLKDDEIGKLSDMKNKKERIKEMQNNILVKLSKEDFKILHKYKTINALTGFINENAIKVLEKNPSVERIYLDRKAYASLSESVPLIEADDVWNLGYTGQGQAVCVIDTGVDYLHADLGNPGCNVMQVIDGTTEANVVESLHNYPNNYGNTWTITKTGYTSIAVHFERIGIEKGYYDYIEILDANNNVVQTLGSDLSWSSSYCEDMYDVWSVSVPGDTIKVRLKSDSSYNCYGFKIDKVLNGEVSSTFTNCGQVIGGYDFVNGDANPMDDQGHGTHVAGIVASQNSVYKGVAPGAKIIAAKVLDSQGSGWFSNVAAGVDWCTDNKNAFGISVITMSLGDGGEYNNPSTQCDPYETAQAISTAVSQGIFVSVASGNEAYTNGISYPACASDATSVGATYDANVGRKRWGTPTLCTDSTTYADKIVCFTNRDEILDLLAPGSDIISTKLGGGTVSYSGTSMSAPHVAGVAALMKEANPSLIPIQIRNTLKSTGKPIYDSATGLTFSRINASAAVKSVAEFISITLIGYPLDFGNFDYGTTDNPASGNAANQYIVRVESETTVNVDIYHKGDDFVSRSNTIPASNVKYDKDSNIGGAIQLDNNYLSAIYTNKGLGDYNLYYWMSIPSGQTAGNYQSAIYIKAVKTGSSP